MKKYKKIIDELEEKKLIHKDNNDLLNFDDFFFNKGFLKIGSLTKDIVLISDVIVNINKKEDSFCISDLILLGLSITRFSNLKDLKKAQ